MAVWLFTNRVSLPIPTSVSSVPRPLTVAPGPAPPPQFLQETQGQLGLRITEVTYPAVPFQEESSENRGPKRQMLPIP